MTHFAGIVLLTQQQIESPAASLAETNLESVIEPLIAQYDENDGPWGADGTRYDWWVVGGRFTGALSGYKPWEDEANYEPCRFCEGTGTTTQAVADQYPAYREHVGKPCIQCNREDSLFPGKVMRFAGFGYNHVGDIQPVRELDVEKFRFIPGVLVTPDGEWHEQGRNGMFATILPDEDGNEPKEADEWKAEFLRLLEAHRDATAVLVDFHV